MDLRFSDSKIPVLGEKFPDNGFGNSLFGGVGNSIEAIEFTR
jgi:hypothetical protein